EGQMAPIDFMDPRQSERYTGEIPIPLLPDFADFDLGLDNPTHYEAFRILVPWLAFDKRGAGLPADFYGLDVFNTDPFAALDFSRYFQPEGAVGRLASITGPQTLDTAGWLPAKEELPYSIGFENAAGAGGTVNEIQIVTELDSELDPRSFEF